MVPEFQKTLLAGMATLTLGGLTGCSHCEKCAGMGDITPKPLGTISDEVWRQQESNAEASDFVVYEHEWAGNSTQMNDDGIAHVKQIAARAGEVPFPIIVQRSSMSVRQGTKYGFPVHNDEELDHQRREFLVSALSQMGVQDAEQRVVIAPALTPGFQSYEAERAYGQGFNQSVFGLGGIGGGVGGGIGGGFGGF
jgi:hypothetical protein